MYQLPPWEVIKGGKILEKCNHKDENGKTTIYIDKTNKKMVYPMRYIGICLKCNENFEFFELPTEE